MRPHLKKLKPNGRKGLCKDSHSQENQIITLGPKTPPGPHPCSQHPLHTVRAASCLSPSGFARDRLRHTGKTQSWEEKRAAQSLLCFWHVCRCVCTWLPLVREFLSVWLLCHLRASLSHSPRPSTYLSSLCGFQSLRVSPCVSPCLVCGFPSSPPAHKPFAFRRSDVCCALSFPWVCGNVSTTQ